jgi:hypothetical protein
MGLGRLRVGFVVAAAAAVTSTGAIGAEQLSLGAKHWAPTIFKQSGTGTSNAIAEAKVTRAEIEGWCANWTPDDKGCVQREMSSEMAMRVYRASADCTRGRITAVDGNTYSLSGTWDNSDIGGGRTRWRDKSGKIVGRDNASGGLGISQQWEVLCPGPLRVAPASAARPSAPPAASGAPAFSVGQAVEAKYGREWIRGRVNRIVQTAGAKGPELAYDVQLVNGKRGVVPARMLRPAPGG